jgi:uncharacterized membrane protein YqjE
MATASERPSQADQSLPELLKQLSEQTQTLVRQELQLAKAEMTEKGKKAGVGAGLFGAAGLFGVFAFATFTTMVIALLTTALDHVWLAALIVTVVYAAIGGVMAMRGRSELQAATPSAPEQTIETVKEDVEWAKTRARSAGT